MYLLDTTHCLKYLFGSDVMRDRFQELGAEQINTSEVVRGELLYGVYKSERFIDNLKLVETLFETIFVFPINHEISDTYARIKVEILDRFAPKDRSKRRNFRISSLGFSDNDIWVAATAIQYNLVLISADSDIKRLQGILELYVEDW